MNGVYDKARARAAEGGLGWLSGNIKAVLVDLGAYTPDLATHEFLSDVPLAARITTTVGNFAGKTNTAGVCDADDVLFSGVSGPTCEALVIYRDTGVAGTSELIAFIDTVASGLPVTPTPSSQVGVRWGNGPNKIFKL